MKLRYVLTVVFTLFLLSCPEEFNYDDTKFWVVDFSSPVAANKQYQIDAEFLASGVHCTIWAEKGSNLSYSTAASIAREFDNKIYPKMMEAFGCQFTLSNGKTENTMQYADVDGDGKLCILFMDIKDSYSSTNRSYIAGYFYPLHLYIDPFSNRRDMIFIDTYPGPDPGSTESNMTIAHETQHLMNYSTTLALRSTPYRREMDIWIDEGLSSAAEYLYAGTHNYARVNWFNTNGNGAGKINQGNNFFVWDNHGSVLDDYSTVYLFFQWLRLQSNGTGIYKEIISSAYSDYKAVTTAAAKYSLSGDWGTLLGNWLAANYENHSSNINGYKNDPVLKNIKVPGSAGIGASVSLYPGEGVYSKVNGSHSFDGSGNIKYVQLTGNVLLTYNNSTNNKEGTSPGSTTGTPLSLAASSNTAGRFLFDFNEPHQIGAHGLLPDDYTDSINYGALLKPLTDRYEH